MGCSGCPGQCGCGGYRVACVGVGRVIGQWVAMGLYRAIVGLYGLVK